MTTIMRKLFLLLLITIGSTGWVFATHGMGGDINYECLGPDSFRVQLSLYEDCTGSGDFGTTTEVQMVSSCGDTIMMTLLRLPGSGNDITPLCPGSTSPCDGGSQLPIGVLEHIYEGTVKLPPGTCTWIISYTICCRNHTITNLQNPGNERIYLSATLEQGVVNCNSSPQFLNEPVPFICVNQAFNYNHGAFDPDGDSLSFSLVPCRGENGVAIPFAGGYSLNDPLSSSTGVTVDPHTGAISFTPDLAQVAVLCMKVEEYRNGVKIGEVYRDLQIVVSGCNNPAPIASGINGSSDYHHVVCAGSGAINFTVNSSDPDPNQSVEMSWNEGIPDATYDISPGQYPTGNFSWLPPDSARGIFFITVTVQDDGCPSVSTNVFTYRIEIVDTPTVDAGMDVTLCEGDTVQLNATASPSHVAYAWQPDSGMVGDSSVSNPLLRPDTSGYYYVTVTDSNGCQRQDSVQMMVDPAPVVDVQPEATTIDKGKMVQLTATSGFSNYVWLAGDSIIKANHAESINVEPENNTIYVVQVTNDNGCTGLDTAEVVVSGSIDMPNAFTPNGDGINDYFYVANNVPIEVTSFRIYSRWGKLLFKSTGYGADEVKGWDGTHAGHRMEIGVYVYTIKGYLADSQETFSQEGNITLIR